MAQTFEKGKLKLHVERTGNDIYGNPLYRLTPSMTMVSQYRNFFFQDKKIPLYRRYFSKNYAIIQSYNIGWDVENILNVWDEQLKASNLAY